MPKPRRSKSAKTLLGSKRLNALKDKVGSCLVPRKRTRDLTNIREVAPEKENE